MTILLAMVAPQIGWAQNDDIAALNQQFVQLYRQGKYSEATEVAERALELAEKKFGNIAVTTGLHNLNFLYQALGRCAAAEPLLKRSLAFSEKALGKNHPDVAFALNSLAGLYRDQGRYAVAEPLYKRSLAISETKLGKDHPDVATTLSNLAGLYRPHGRYAAAEPLFKRSIAVKETTLGKGHLDVGESLNNLSRTKCYLGNIGLEQDGTSHDH